MRAILLMLAASLAGCVGEARVECDLAYSEEGQVVAIGCSERRRISRN